MVPLKKEEAKTEQRDKRAAMAGATSAAAREARLQQCWDWITTVTPERPALAGEDRDKLNYSRILKPNDLRHYTAVYLAHTRPANVCRLLVIIIYVGGNIHNL